MSSQGFDDSMSEEGETISQFYPNGQIDNSKATEIRLTPNLSEALDTFNNELIIRNNSEDMDDGVSMILKALDNKDDKVKWTALSYPKGVRKEHMVAGLGFLMNISYDEAKAEYRNVLVDDLRLKIINVYNLLAPNNCDKCNKVYRCDNFLEELLHCFICRKGLCPECSPFNSNIPQNLQPVCSVCVNRFRNNENLIVTKEKDKDDDKNEDGGGVDDDKHEEGDEVGDGEKNVKEGDNGYKKVVNKKTKTNKQIPSDDKKEAVCKFYLRSQCKHGRLGKDCEYSHPKICFQKLNHGTCDKEECSYFHDYCSSVINKDICRDSKCKKFHKKDNLPQREKNKRENKDNSDKSDKQDFREEPKRDPDPKTKGSKLEQMMEKMFERIEQISAENQMIKQRINHMNPWGQMPSIQPSWGTLEESSRPTKQTSWNI